MQLFKHSLDQGDLVGVVVDHEVRREADGLAIDAEPAGAHAVERAHVEAGSVFTEEFCGAFAHLTGGFVRKGNGEHSPWRDAMFDDEVRDPVRYDTSFAAARPSKDEDRAIAVGYGETLGFVQSFEEFGLSGDRFHWSQSNIGSSALSIWISPARKTCANVEAQGGAPTEGIDCLCF